MRFRILLRHYRAQFGWRNLFTFSKKATEWFVHPPGKCSPHNSRPAAECHRATQIKQMPHPVFSPDSAPRKTLLFVHLKNKRTEYEISERKSLKWAITGILNGIGQETLRSVLEVWLNRLK
jgi:hypothetical protein